jgi:hypothetical protein
MTEIPNSKLSGIESRSFCLGYLDIGFWNLFGIWDLGFFEGTGGQNGRSD